MPTRFYLPNGTTPPITPAYDSWTVTSAAERRKMVGHYLLGAGAKTNTALASHAIAETSASIHTQLFRQYVSAPLASDFRLEGTFKGYIQAMESSTSSNAFMKVSVRVVAPNGTVRGTAYGPVTTSTAGAGTEVSTINENRPIHGGSAGGTVTLTAVNALAGDHIVVEIGVLSNNTSTTSFTNTLRFGDPTGNDLSEVFADYDNDAPWIEFSQNIPISDPDLNLPPAITITPRTGGHFAQALGVVVALTVTAVGGATENYEVDRSGDVITLELIETEVDVVPASLRVNVGMGPPNGTAYFFIDGSPNWYTTVDLDDVGAASQILIPLMGTLTTGDHTIAVSSTTVAPASGAAWHTFTVLDGFDHDDGLGEGAPPPPPNEVDRWVFQAYDFSDVNAVDTYTLPINPDTVKRGTSEVVIDSEPTVVSDGRVYSWEGQMQPARWEWGGHLLTEDHVLQMQRWGTTGQRFYVTDHYGMRALVKVESYSTERVRDIERPWHHTYQMQVWVLEALGVGA